MTRGDRPFAETALSFAAALLMHGALVLTLTVQTASSGAGLRETAAISLNLIETRIVDAARESPDQSDAATEGQIDRQTGARQDSAAAARREADQAEAQKAAPAADKPVKKTPASKPREAKDAAQPAKAQRKGGVRARGAARGQRGAGAVSASRGAINSYLGRVRARVASRRPRNLRGRGTAIVSFGISHSGGVRYVRLARSSGNRSLDSAALSAVRRAAPFPRPPAGTSLRQLSLRIPFYFK